MPPAPPGLLTFDLRRDPPGSALQAAAEALSRGLLVILPSETVYGLAAREDRPEALQRLARVKPGRSGPFTRAVADPASLGARLAPYPATARRVAARWWPGPVTQVLDTSDGGTLGVRVPGHPWTRRLLAEVGAPVLFPSANLSGEPAPTGPEDIAPAVRSAAAVMVADGRAALGDASTVVRPRALHLRVLRAGVVSAHDLRAHAAGRVLVVCSGNTCRSPMAAALLEAAWARAASGSPGLVPPRIASRGAATDHGRTASSQAVAAMARRRLDVSGHVTAPLDPAELAAADQVLCMTRAHVARVEELLPRSGGGDRPAIELFDPAGREIEDPFGGPDSIYEATAATLEDLAAARVAACLEDR